MKLAEVPAARSHAKRPGRPSLSNEGLLDKAFALFLEQGFERTSLDAITAAAGMAKRTVYQRYGDKETLFRESLKRAITNWMVPIESLRAAESDDLEQTLLAVGRLLMTKLMDPIGIGLLRITNAESIRLPDIGAFTYELGTERTIIYLADLLRRRLDPGSDDLDHWRQAGISYLYLVVCGPPTMTAWGMVLSAEEIDTHTRFGVRVFLHGLLGEAESAKRADTGTTAASRRASYDPADRADVGTLRIENERLKTMLIASMLDAADLRERLGQAACAS